MLARVPTRSFPEIFLTPFPPHKLSDKQELQGFWDTPREFLSSALGKYLDFICFKVTENSTDKCLFGLHTHSKELSPNPVLII